MVKDVIQKYAEGNPRYCHLLYIAQGKSVGLLPGIGDGSYTHLNKVSGEVKKGEKGHLVEITVI